LESTILPTDGRPEIIYFILTECSFLRFFLRSFCGGDDAVRLNLIFANHRPGSLVFLPHSPNLNAKQEAEEQKVSF
jgi:hypothetical protein